MAQRVGLAAVLAALLLPVGLSAAEQVTFSDRFDGDLSRWQPLHAENWEIGRASWRERV